MERIERTGQELRAHPEMLAAGPTAGVAQAAISGETKHAVAEVKSATAAAGGGARGAAVAVNNLYNPGAPVVDAVEATAVAAAKGDVRATAKAGANVGITAVPIEIWIEGTSGHDCGIIKLPARSWAHRASALARRHPLPLFPSSRPVRQAH